MLGRTSWDLRAASAVAFVLSLVAIACGGEAPAIDTIALPGARVGQSYEVKLEASGADEVAWSVADGRLPAGLALSKLGRILGTPEEAGRFEVVIEARSEGGKADRKPLVLQVGEGRPLTLHTTRLPEAVVGVPYGAKLDATGGVAPYRWTVTSGALPDGLAFAAESDHARLVGAPRGAGSFEFALEVRDDRGASVTRQVTLVVNARRTPIRIDTETLPPAHRGEPYRVEIVSGGGAGESLAWDVTDGALPPGLSLGSAGTPATTVTGTPAEAGRYRFSVTVIEASGGIGSKSFEIEVDADPIRFSSPQVAAVAEVGRAISSTLAVAGGSGRKTRFTVESGTLPRGVLLADERLTGRPTEPGRFPLVVRVSDDTGSATVAVELEVLDTLRITPPALVDAEVGVSYTATVTATGAAGTASRFEARGLPPGIDATLAGHRLRLTGRPRRAGTFKLSISATDARGRTAASDVTLEISPRLHVATTELTPARVDEPYEADLQARGGRPGSRDWQIVQGRLPYGIALDSRRGRLIGTATTAGRYTFTAAVRGSRTATRALSLQVVDPTPPPAPAPVAASPTPQVALPDVGEASVDAGASPDPARAGASPPGVDAGASSSPADAASSPTDAASAPADSASSPTDAASAPADAASPPADAGSAPADAASAPVDAEAASSPADAGVAPSAVSVPDGSVSGTPADAGAPPTPAVTTSTKA